MWWLRLCVRHVSTLVLLYRISLEHLNHVFNTSSTINYIFDMLHVNVKIRVYPRNKHTWHSCFNFYRFWGRLVWRHGPRKPGSWESTACKFQRVRCNLCVLQVTRPNAFTFQITQRNAFTNDPTQMTRHNAFALQMTRHNTFTFQMTRRNAFAF